MSEQISLKEIDGMLDNQQVDNQADSNVTEETPNETVTFSLADIDAMLDEGEKKPDFAAAKKASDALKVSTAQQPTAQTEETSKQGNEQTGKQGEKVSSTVSATTPTAQTGEGFNYGDVKSGANMSFSKPGENHGPGFEVGPLGVDAYQEEYEDKINGGYIKGEYTPIQQDTGVKVNGVFVSDMDTNKTLAGWNTGSAGWRFPGSSFAQMQPHHNQWALNQDSYFDETEKLKGKDVQEVIDTYNKELKRLNGPDFVPTTDWETRLYAMQEYVHARDLGFADNADLQSNKQEYIYRNSVRGSEEYSNMLASPARFQVDDYVTRAKLLMQEHPFKSALDIKSVIDGMFTDYDKKLAWVTALDNYRRGETKNIKGDYLRLLSEPMKVLYDSLTEDQSNVSTVNWVFRELGFKNDLTNFALWTLKQLTGTSDDIGTLDIMRSGAALREARNEGSSEGRTLNTFVGGLSVAENILPLLASAGASSLITKSLGMGVSSGIVGRAATSSFLRMLGRSAFQGGVNFSLFTYFDGALDVFQNPQAGLMDIGYSFGNPELIKESAKESLMGAFLGMVGSTVAKGMQKMGAGKIATVGTSFLAETLAFAGGTSVKQWQEINEKLKKGEDVEPFTIKNVLANVWDSATMLVAMKIGHGFTNAIQGREKSLKNAKGEKQDLSSRNKSADQFGNIGMHEMESFLRNPNKYLREHGITDETDIDDTSLGKEYKAFLAAYGKGGMRGVDAESVGTAVYMVQGQVSLKPISWSSEIDSDGKTVHSYDKNGNLIETKTFKNEKKAQEWQEELEHDAEKYDLTELEFMSAQTRANSIHEKAVGDVFDHYANQIPTVDENGQPNELFDVPTREELCDTILNYKISKLKLEQDNKLREEGKEPLLTEEEREQMQKIMDAGREVVTLYENALVNRMYEYQTTVSDPYEIQSTSEEAHRILEKKPSKRTEMEKKSLAAYADILKAESERKPYIGSADYDGRRVFVKNDPRKSDKVFYEDENGNVQMASADRFSDFTLTYESQDPRRDDLENLVKQNRATLEEIKKNLDAEEAAKRQAKQQEIEEKKKNAPVIDVQQPEQPEPKVEGSETPSPSTETLQETQAETPEPPKEEKSEASPEGKIEEPKTAAEHREVIAAEQEWLDEHQEADPAEREQHRQRKWASERALGLRDENNVGVAQPPTVEQPPKSATAEGEKEVKQTPTADVVPEAKAETATETPDMEITNEDLLSTTTLTEEDLADPEAGALKRAARRNAERQRDDAIAYSRGEIKDKPENYDYWKERLGLEEPKAENAMQPVEDVPEEQKADSKEAEAAATDRSPQGELAFGEETPEQREAREKQERVAKAASLRSRHTQLSEEIKQKQLEYRFINDRKKQYQARQELNKLYDEIEGVEQQLKETGEPMQVKRFNRPAKKERTQHAARKAYDEMRKKYKDDSEVMEILDDTEPQDIYEQIGIALGSSKLLFKSKGEGASRKRGVADETGWKWNDVKGMFQLFDNEKGQSVQNWAETFWADLDEGTKNRYSSTDIANMMLDVLGGASTIGDLRNIVLANRVRQAEELLEHREKEEEYWRDMERHEQEMRETEEEAMLENIKDLAENFDEQEYYSKFADEILKAQRDDSTGSNRDLPQGERSGSGNDGRNGEAGERETASDRDNKDNTSVERPTGETGADSQENGREPRRLDSQRVSQERAGLSAKEREIVNRVNAGINEAIDDLDAEIRDLEKKGDEEGAEAARLEKEMLENSREDMIDDALAGYEDLQGFKNGTRAEKQAAERVEKSLADRKAKRMRELLEKLRDPNTSDAKRRAVVRQLADLGVDASGYLEGRNEIKEIEEPGEKDETPKERVIDIKEALDSAESMAKELADMLTDEDYAQFIDWDNGDKEESALMMFDDYWMSPGDPETWAWRNFMYGDNSEPSRYGKAFLEELVKHLDKEIPKAMERAAKAREEQEKAKQEEREKKNKILQPVNDARKNLTYAYKKGDTKTLRQAQKKMAESMISAIEDMVSQFGYEGGTTVEQSIESMKKIRKAAEKGSAEYKTADYIIKALRKFQKDSVKVGQGRVELNAATLKDPVSREYLEQRMEDEGWSEEARKQFMQTLDDAAEVVLEMGKRYKRLGDWNKMEILSETDEVDYSPRWRLMNRKGQWIPNRSAFKKNGEYPWNIDLGTLCTKRESFDALVQLIAEKGMAQNLGPTQIEAIKELLKENDFLTACDICFNETKRARVISYANQISNNWRVVSEAIGVKDKMVGDPIALTQEQRNTLHRMAGRGYKSAFQELIPESERRQYKGEEKSGNEIDLGITASMMQRIAKQMLIDPTLVGKLKPETLITTEGMDWFLRTYGGHTDVNGILASAWGSGTPKPIEGFNLYDPLSWRDDYDQKKENPRWHEGLKSRPSIDWLMNNGGFRAQSFTDYHPMLFLDYLQMFTDVGVRKLPIHIYTKVPALVKLFGGCGAKINMSLVPKMEDGVDAEHAGLKPDGKGGWEYAWDNDSFPIEEAFSLRQDPRFRGNVGIIAVGLSDAHILKMLDDPTIDQVIPYHKSGMPESVQIKTGLKNATDYTDQQTTGGKPKKAADFNFNEAVRRTGDPRKAASEYVKWCEMNGYTPKFEQFKDHPNYYKVLADFRLFDNEGKYSEQEAVNPGKILGDNWKQELEESLNDKTMQEAVKTRVAGNEKLMKDVERLMSKQRMDGAVRDEMVKKLKGALGKDNVESLKQNEFFNALEDAYKQTMGAEQAKAKVEVLRTTNGVVYGFASGGKITLNENVFNAETPIHEFTHIWVKVAQRENAKLWKKGKDLLKQTGEWQEVMNDDLYADIRGDEDAVASEVLARIVGSEGADYVRRLLDPEHKPLKQGGVYNQIKEWLREMFNNVRSLFAPSIRNLTYDEFVNMPLKTLFDEAEAKRFLEAKTRLESEGRLEGDVEGEGIELSVVKDPKEIERLEKEPVEYGYRNVSMKEDGTFRSPMADKLGKKGEKSRSTEPFKMNAWEKSDENPDLATDDGKINLIKPNGLGSVGAVDYNPYIHIRPTTLNKQFKNAWERNDLVYLKVAYPASELDKGYHAPKAKLSVGKHPWNGGELILSRWDKPMEIVPWEEVANEWVNEFKDRGVEFDIVPPKLLPILMERGVEILPPHKGMGKACNDAYQEKVVNRGTRYEKMAKGYETSSRNTELRYRLGEDKNPTFYSNAEKAVEGIKQNKATAEQWKAMLTKAGGIKAGEDKWMGLSEWLDENKGKSLTKDEVLQFIADNGIKMEETTYSEAPQSFESLKREYDQWLHDEGFDYAQEQLRERFGNNASIAFDDIGGELVIANEADAAALLGSNNIINQTRLDYTTEGLENKREIAFVVPTVEQYQEGDVIHFGPENQGKAIMWVRFGETTDADGNRVLVIDEIQSNRHQDAREKGYKETFTRSELKKRYEDALSAFNKFKETYNSQTATEEQADEYFRLQESVYRATADLGGIDNIHSTNYGKIPAAPFEKNWHEVAMKRMLRLAAEEGFDKVAWTTGAQQAERYGIGGVVESITKGKTRGENTLVSVQYKNGKHDSWVVAPDGKVVDGGITTGENLSDLIGKELSEKVMSLDENGAIEGDGLRIGGEGMKGFYDQMLPRFMDKYGKKWGVKTGTVELPNVEEAGRTMHAVDVTPEMKESVMQGQPLFRKGFSRPRGEGHMERVAEGVERANKQLGGNAKVVREADLGKDVPKNAQAWYDPNTGDVHVVAERVNGAEDASRAVWHEEIGHKAMSELLGNRYNEWLDDVHKLLGSEHADAMQRLREKYAKELEGKSEEAQNRLLADEWIAELAERGEKDLSTWQKVKGMFRNWLWKHFGVMLGDGDIDYMLHKALAERRKGYRSKAMMSIAERRRAEEGNAMAEQSRRYRLLDEENRAEAKSRARDLLEAERNELNDKKTQMEDTLNRALTVRRGEPSAENLAMSPKQRRELAASIERLEKRIDALNDSLTETDLTDPERVVNRAWDHVGLATEAEMLMQKAESLMKTKDILRNAGVKSVENLTPEQRKEYDRYLWNGKIADARLTAMRDARPVRPFEGSIDDNLGREPQYDDFRHPDLDRDDLSERDRSYLEGKANDDYARAKAEWNRKKEQLIEQLDDYEAECNDWRMRQRDYMREIVDAEKKLRADWQTDYWSAMENNQEADALLHVADMTGIPLTSKHDVQTYLRELRYEHVRRQQHAEGEDYKFIKEIESMVDKAVGTGSLANKVRKYGDRKQVMRDLIDMMEGTKEVTEEMKPIVKKIQQWFDDMFEWQVASGLVYAPWKYRQGYVPHLWNIDASRPDADAAAKIEKAGGLVPTRMNSPFMNERFYDTYEEGIQHGLVPKHKSIIDLIKEYSKEVNKAVSNRQALDILRFVKAPIETEVWVEQEGGGKEKVKQTQWLPIVIDAGEVPPKGVQYNAYKNSAFYKDGTPQFLILSPRYVKGTERNIYSMFGEQGYVSSKDAADSYLEKALGTADKASQMVKQTNLMFSAFHGIALTEHMLGSSRNPLRVIKQALYDTIIESFITGKTLRMRKADVAEDAMSHFVKMGNSYDFGRSMDVLTKLSDMINNPDNPEWRKFVNARNDKERAKAAKALIRTVFGGPLKLAKMLKKGNDFILWDMLHDGYKLSVWDLRSRKLREKAEKKGWSEAELNRRLDDLGQTINDMFGGQHWELLNASPRTMRNLRLFFLSPDWNASWMRLWGRMAGMGKLRNDNFFRWLKNEEGKLQIPISGKAIKKAWKENNAQGLAFTVMLVSGLMCHIGYSLMNLAMRKKDIEEELAKAEEIRKTDPNYKSPYEEEGITPITWENFLGRANEWILSPWNSLSDPGRGTYVYVGRDANGVSRYIRPGKQMRELFELFIDSEDHLDLGAWYKAGMRKANPFAQLIHEAGTGYSLTGWENKKLTQTYGAERELNRLKYVILHAISPISAVDPIEKEDTEKMGWRMAYPVSKGMTWYRGNKLLEEAIANDDSEMVERIRRSFVLNGMGEDFEKAYTSSLSKVRRNAAKAEDYENKTPDELFKMAAKSNDPKMRKKYVDKATEKLESTEEKEGKTAREAMEEYQQKAQKEGNYLLHCTAQDMEYDTHMKIFMKKAEEDGSVVATFRKMGGTIPKKTQVKKGKKVVDSRIEWKGKDGYTNADCEKFYKEHEDELIAYYRMNMFREGYNARIKEMKDLKGKEAEAKMKEIREYRNKWMQYASEYLDTTTWRVKKHKK